MRPQAPIKVSIFSGIGLLTFAVIGNRGEEVRRAVASASPAPTAEEVRGTAAPVETSQAQPALPASASMHYEVRRAETGESLQSFASRTGSNPASLDALNRLGGTWPPQRPLVVPTSSNVPRLNGEPVVIDRGPAGQQRIALTLDAGSEAGPVPGMLQTLRERHIKITFFVTGDFVATYPDIVKEIARDGHEFGNHSLTHPDFRKQSDARIMHELEATEDILKLVTGKTTRPYFRPPYGEYDDRVVRLAQDAGYLTICWSLDSLDSVGVTKSPRFLVERITARLRPQDLQGAIVLMHCDSPATASALPIILDRFKSLDLDVVTLSRLLNAE
jgi:peptidoglycan/xylan/chitin deacetylase (PgdA/CDA1 family)